jgi:hypothetical protein
MFIFYVYKYTKASEQALQAAKYLQASSTQQSATKQLVGLVLRSTALQPQKKQKEIHKCFGSSVSH